MDENREYDGSIRSRDIFDHAAISSKISYTFQQIPVMSKDWECHLFGGDGIKYIPREGQVPNVLVRFMMKVLLGCKWVKLNK